jgi:hypothetical protein
MFSSLIVARQAEGGPNVPTTPEKDIEDNTTQLLAVVGTLYGLALLAVLLRVWVRTRMLKAFGTAATAFPCHLKDEHRLIRILRAGRLAYDCSDCMRTKTTKWLTRISTDLCPSIAP